jgi:hypothetical protein
VRVAGRDGDPHQAAPPPAEEGECDECQQGGGGTGGGAGEGEPLVRVPSTPLFQMLKSVPCVLWSRRKGRSVAAFLTICLLLFFLELPIVFSVLRVCF